MLTLREFLLLRTVRQPSRGAVKATTTSEDVYLAARALEPAELTALFKLLAKSIPRDQRTPRFAKPALITAAVFGISGATYQLIVFMKHWPLKDSKDFSKETREAVFSLVTNLELLIPAVVTAILAWLTYSLIKLTLEAIDLARDESEVSRGTLNEVKEQTASAKSQAETASRTLDEMKQQREDAHVRSALQAIPFIDASAENIFALERAAFRNDYSAHDDALPTAIAGSTQADFANVLNSLVRTDDRLMASRIRLQLKLINAGLGPALKVHVAAEPLGYYFSNVRSNATNSANHQMRIPSRVLFALLTGSLRPPNDFVPEFPLVSVSSSSWTLIPSQVKNSIDIDVLASWRFGGEDVNAYREYRERQFRGRGQRPPIALRISCTYFSLDGTSFVTTYIVFIREIASPGRESSLSAEIVCHASLSDPNLISIEQPTTATGPAADDERAVVGYWNSYFESRDVEKKILSRAKEMLNDCCFSDEVAERLMRLPSDAAPIEIAAALDMDPLLFRLLDVDDGGRFLNEWFNS